MFLIIILIIISVLYILRENIEKTIIDAATLVGKNLMYVLIIAIIIFSGYIFYKFKQCDINKILIECNNSTSFIFTNIWFLLGLIGISIIVYYIIEKVKAVTKVK